MADDEGLRPRRGRQQGFRGEAPPSRREDEDILEANRHSDVREPGRFEAGQRIGRGPLSEAYAHKQAAPARSTRLGKTPSSFSGNPALQNDPRLQAMNSAKRAQMEMVLGDTNNPHNPFTHMPVDFFSHLSDLADNPAVTPQDFDKLMTQAEGRAQQHMQYAAQAQPEIYQQINQKPGETHEQFQQATDKVRSLMGGSDIDFRGQTGRFAGHNAEYKQEQIANPVDQLPIPDDAKTTLKAALAAGTPLKDVIAEAHKIVMDKDKEKVKGPEAEKASPYIEAKIKDMTERLKDTSLSDEDKQQMRHALDDYQERLPGGSKYQSGNQPSQPSASQQQQQPPQQLSAQDKINQFIQQRKQQYGIGGAPQAPVATHPGTGQQYPEGSILHSPTTNQAFVVRNGQIVPADPSILPQQRPQNPPIRQMMVPPREQLDKTSTDDVAQDNPAYQYGL
jgi:hypothetical protein